MATRLTEDQMIRQVLLGGGNMPAYGSTLSPAETTALVRFLDTLHPNYQPAADDASRRGGADRRRAAEVDGGARRRTTEPALERQKGWRSFRTEFWRRGAGRCGLRWGSSIAGTLYLRGWRALQRTRARELPRVARGCVFGGLLAMWIALASPIDALDDYLLSAHMLQHFILMSVAPPLMVLGAPLVPMLRGLPRWVIRALRPVFASRVRAQGCACAGASGGRVAGDECRRIWGGMCRRRSS